MRGTIVGITDGGERLRFEIWVYWTWKHGALKDPWLLQQLHRCRRFEWWA